jgi:hypothetical protein
MPRGDWVEQLPPELLRALYIAVFATGAAFATTALSRGLDLRRAVIGG